MWKSNLWSTVACGVGLVISMMASIQPALATETRANAARFADSGNAEFPGPAQALARHVLTSADNAGLPFAIVDKQAARVLVYRQDGTLIDQSSVLLGATIGDHATQGVGYRTQTGQLRPEDRTTPSGRYDSAPGRNLNGEAVVWIDYEKGLAIHRLRPAPAWQRRAERMASPDPQVKRISAGCVVVPESFFDRVIQPMFGHGRGVVYVLPESGSWDTL